MRPARRGRHVGRLVLTAAGALAVALLGVPSPALADTAPPDSGTPVTVSADPLPTVQIDGVVWSQVVVGNTVYATGDFRNARPAGAAPGTQLVPRAYLLAYDVRTGVLISSFAPTLNAQGRVLAASPDGTRVYVGGDFTTVNGQARSRIAAFDTATGALVSTFKPTANGVVKALHVSGPTVYLGGSLTSVSGVATPYAAAVRASDGGVLPWRPSPDGSVQAMTLTFDKSKLVLGGSFRNVGGQPAYGMAAVDPTSGAILPWAATEVIRDAGPNSAILSLSADAQGVYGSGYVYGDGGNLEGAFRVDSTTGQVIWIEDCHGDTVSTYVTPNVVYAVGHPHYCGNIGGFPQTNPWTMHHSLAFSKQPTGVITPDTLGYHSFAGQPRPTLLDWFPDWHGAGSYTHQGQAGWNVTGNGQYVVVGGEFTSVNTYSTQQGLVRFAIPSIAPNKVGPVSNDGLTPSATSFVPGRVRVAWLSTFDRDNEELTYKVFRNVVSLNDTPVFQVTQRSTFWVRTPLAFTDTNVTPGTRYTYRVYAFDGFGNLASRGAPSVTVSTPTTVNRYAGAVSADSPTWYYRLGETSGTQVTDVAGGDHAVASAGVTRGAAGALLNDSDRASTFPGTSTGFAASQFQRPAPATVSVEAWIKTTTTTGGKIVGFGKGSSGDSTRYDRHLYMDDAGRVLFGAYPGVARTVASTRSYNDGAWHQVVGTLGVGGMTLYVDGALVASRTDTTTSRVFDGFWRIGGDNLSGWPNRPTSRFFAGAIDEVSIYPAVLPADRVLAHYVASGR